MYELEEITENGKKNSQMSEIPATERKERSPMVNLIIANTIIENQRKQNQNTYIYVLCRCC